MSAALALPLAVLLTAVVALVDWRAVARRDGRTRRWSKPGVLVGLLAVALVLGAADTTTGRLVLAALVLGMLGDVLLLEDSEARFLSGLAAFLVGHVAWVMAFVTSGLDRPGLAWLGVVVLVGALAAGRRILPATWSEGGPGLTVPVAAYMGVIGAMAVTGWATGHLLVGLGATLFVVSDTVLALAKFVEERPWHELAVITTYHLAQALLLAGLLT